MKIFVLKRKHIFIISYVTIIVLLILAVLSLFYFGIIHFNNPSKKLYPIRGVDVSEYQGEIDWVKLSKEDISFAFIKATEGSSYVDPCFAYNWGQAKSTKLKLGVYHFFSFESSGKKQAENFIKTVGDLEGMLPPVIDVEFYKKGGENNLTQESVKAELTGFIAEIKDHYGVWPIIYATGESYNAFISGHFSDCPIWIRNVFFSPHLSDGRKWTFWQYSNRHRLTGYKGEESYIDMNVFYGNKERFDELYGGNEVKYNG